MQLHKCKKVYFVIQLRKFSCEEGIMKAKILVVDDEKVARKSLADILRLEGYDVTEVEEGPKALDLLKEESYDLMLLDIRMPGMDGIEVMQKATESSPDTEIIMLTAHGSMESAVESLRFGAHDYLIKPSSPQEILSSVAGALARHAEAQRKRLLLGQMETSLQQLKDAEGVSQANVAGQRVISLPDGVMVDLARREVWRGNDRVMLTPTEGKLLKVLLENKGRVMTHKDLVFLVQGYEITDWEAPEVLRPLVSRLRRKLSKFPDGDKWIVNVRGTGYVFDIDDNA
jgi:DNA-binding response OmpR family regulator